MGYSKEILPPKNRSVEEVRNNPAIVPEAYPDENRRQNMVQR